MTPAVYGYVTDLLVEAHYQNLIKEYTKRGNTAGLKALELERSGGLCHYCDVPFREVVVDNTNGKFHYFEPACHCYKRCNRLVNPEHFDDLGNLVPAELCDRWMVEERFRNISRCLICFGEPKAERTEEKPKRARHFRDGKKEAAGGDG